MKLSDAFENGSSSGSLEVIATVYNINYGHNMEMMKKCTALYEYSLFVRAVCHYLCRTNLEDAIDRAIDYAKKFKCIGEYLIKNKREVRNMLFTEFDQEKYDQAMEENGKLKYAVQLVKRGILPLEEAAKDCNMSVQDFKKTMDIVRLLR